MKKKQVFIIVAVFAILSCNQKPEDNSLTTIHAFISGMKESKVYIQKRVEGEFIAIDSSQVSAGNFKCELKSEKPEFVYLKLGEKQYVPFFVEPGKIEISGNIDSLETISVSGTPANDLLLDFRKEMSVFEKQYEQLEQQFSDASEKNDEKAQNEATNGMEKLDADMRAVKLRYFNGNVNNVFSTYILNRELIYDTELDELKQLLSKIDTSLSRTSMYVRTSEHIDVIKKVAVGQTAPDFKQLSPEGKEIALSSFRGKYVLVDFWASWCRPCRAENPNNVRAYAKYNKKGFEIFGISLDKDKEKWLKAVADDKLTWQHVSELNAWKNSAVKTYGVNSIPHTLLLDPEGKIIAKNLRGDKLNVKLIEIFGF